MKFFLVVLFLMALSVGQEPMPNERQQGSVRILADSTDFGTFAVAVSAAKGTKAERAIVTIAYRTHAPGIKSELLRMKVSAIELVPDMWVMADDVPVTKDKVAWVDVQLVSNVEYQRFTMR